MKPNLSYVALCCALLLIAGCKKKDNADNSSAQKKMLEAGKWQMSASVATTVYKGKDTTMDVYSQMKECDKDDFYIFASNGKASVDENTNKCADDNQVETAPWVLLNNDTKLAIPDDNPDTFDLEITSMQMIWKQTKLNTSGVPVIYTSTFKNIK